MPNELQLRTWLAEAEQARHELIVGTRAVSVSTGSGKSVTYTATDLGKLDAYIASLRKQLGQPTGVGVPLVPTFEGSPCRLRSWSPQTGGRRCAP